MLTWLRNLKRGEKYDLSSIMVLADPAASFSERVHWLEQLVDWLRAENQTTRTKFLLQVLDRNPEWKAKTGELIASLLIDARLTRLFTETGVPSWMSMTHEFMSRFIRVFLPPFSDDLEKSARDGFAQIFYDRSDPDWVKSLPQQTWDDLALALEPWLQTEAVKKKVFFALVEASLILSMKCGSIMVREDFAKRAPEMGDMTSHPALKLQAALLDFKQGSHDIEALNLYLNQISQVSNSVKAHLERYGVSIDLVFQRERLKQYVNRLRFLIHAAEAVNEQSRSLARNEVHDLFGELVSGSAYDQDFYHLVKKNLALASKKVVDFTGSTGKHYIAHTPHEMSLLFWGAMGGGAIMAFAVICKYMVDRKEWPLFLDLFYASLVYSIAFLIVHFLHFTIATKQPSMTAATLASKIHTRNASGKGDEEFALEIKQLVKSQSASVLGNILAVVPLSMLLDLLWSQIFGRHFFNQHEAEHIIQTVSPWRSGEILYAAMTGGLLWLGGIASGWIENASVYHRIPKLIENHKVLKKLFGVKFSTYLSHAYSKNIAGVTSSLTLGVLLGTFPVIGHFFGLPIDIRHVTISTGAAAIAVSSIGIEGMSLITWIEVLLGILMVGIMNFSVSFLLALMVAVRAKEVPFKRAIVVLRRVLRG